MTIDDMFDYEQDVYPDIRTMGIEEFYPDIDAITDEAELMGIDFDDPELLGGFIKKIIKRIKKRIKAKKKARGGKSGTYSVTTPKGAVSISDRGISLTKPYTEAGITTGMIPGGGIQKAGILEQIQSNPLLVAIPAAMLVVIMMSKKKR